MVKQIKKDVCGDVRAKLTQSLKMKKIWMSIGVIGIVLGAVGLTSAFILMSVTNPFGGTFNPVIDGMIEDNWAYSGNRIEQQIDINGSDGNVDAVGYSYMGEINETHIGIAIDEISKQNSSEIGEWLGLWLNNLTQSFGANESNIWSFLFGYFEMNQYLGNGADCLIYDMENDTTYTLLKDSSTSSFYDNEIYDSQKDIASGELRTDGWENPNTWSKTYADDNDHCIISSEQESIDGDVKDHILVNFSIDLQDTFGWLPAESIPDIVASMSNIQLSIDGFFVNQSYTDLNDWNYLESTDFERCNLYIQDNGTINDADLTLQVFHPALVFNVNNSALENGFLNFSIEIYNSTFNPTIIDLWIDSMNLYYDYENNFDGLYGVSTIDDFEIAWDFGVSMNSAIEHRMIEIAIPKTELSCFDDANNKLNIFIEGGGMEINTNLFVYPQEDDELMLSARLLTRSYAFTCGTESYGDYNGGYYENMWSPRTPVWSRNYHQLIL